jgi:hypothetical protein
MSDSQFPGGAPDAFPGDAGGGLAPSAPSDTTAPTAPGAPASAISVATIAIVLTWTAATDPDDASNVLTYNVYRGGAKVATGVSGLTWTDTQTPDGAAHSYTVTAVDPAGNEGPASTATAVNWSAPASGGGAGSGAYPVYICVQTMTVDSPLVMKQYDTPQIVMQLLHANGVPMDLAGKRARLKLQSIGGGSLKVSALTTVLLASLGIVSYQFASTDSDTGGSYNMEFQVTPADGSAGSETYPAASYLSVKITASEG